jgi:hypothetical protein
MMMAVMRAPAATIDDMKTEETSFDNTGQSMASL